MPQDTPRGAADCDDEAGLCDDPPPASLLPTAPTPRSARWGAIRKPKRGVTYDWRFVCENG